MFTGIVEELGAISAMALGADGAHAQLTVRAPKVTSDVSEGDSIAVDGVCLTVVSNTADTFTAQLMAQTLESTTAASWAEGTPVNLERSVTPATRLGGHIVQGHVDGVGRVVAHTSKTGYDEVSIAVPAELGAYIAPQGAIAVDGISLTVIDVSDEPPVSGEPGRTTFTLGIIPQTRAVTTIGSRGVGDAVNIEVDVMAKYAQRLLATRKAN